MGRWYSEIARVVIREKKWGFDVEWGIEKSLCFEKSDEKIIDWYEMDSNSKLFFFSQEEQQECYFV
jgi:hypothetical protein